MRRYKPITGLWLAPTFHRAFYQDVALRWKGFGARYLLMVLVLTWLPIVIASTIGLSIYLSGGAAADLKDFPPLTLKAGQLSSPVAQPFVYHVNGEPLFVLDTIGKTKRPDEKNASILLTHSELVREQDGMIDSKPLSIFPDMTLDAATVMTRLRQFRNLMLPVFFPLFCLISFAYRLVCILVFAALGLALAARYHVRLPYRTLLRLAAVAMTPALLLETILAFAPINLGCAAWLIFPAITLGYLAFAIKAVAPITPVVPVPQPVSDPDSPFP